jgi:hypothetical protein
VAVEAPGKRLDVRRADAVVDVAAVGLDGDRVDIRAQPPKDLGRHAVGGPVGTVEQHAQAAEVETREAQLELAQVVARGTVELTQPADAGAGLVEAPLDLGLLVVADLHALASEELDPVVAIRVVRRRHDGGHVEPVAPHEHGRAGSGQDAADQGVAAPGGDARSERGLQHLTGVARVADDQDLRVVHRQRERRRPAEFQGQVGTEELSRDPADPVRPEQPHEAS